MDKKSLFDLCHIATSEPYLFVTRKVTAEDKNAMYYKSYNQRFKIEDI